MKIDLHVWLHNLSDNTILEEIQKMSAQFDQLKDAVEAENTVIDSAVKLLGDLSAQIIALKDDPAALQALADEVNTKKQALADAVTANTPASGTP